MSKPDKPPVFTQPSLNAHDTHHRVNIATDHSPHAHDNPAFDSCRSRKVSATSDPGDGGPVMKIILNNTHASENISLSSLSGKSAAYTNNIVCQNKRELISQSYINQRGNRGNDKKLNCAIILVTSFRYHGLSLGWSMSNLIRVCATDLKYILSKCK